MATLSSTQPTISPLCSFPIHHKEATAITEVIPLTSAPLRGPAAPPAASTAVGKAVHLDWFRMFPREPKFLKDTDAGNDPNDVLAHVYAAKEYGKDLALVTTTLYHLESLKFHTFEVERIS